MVTLRDLMTFLDDFMGDVGDKDPYMPNGLQVRGREEVKLLATGVSATLRRVCRMAVPGNSLHHKRLHREASRLSEAGGHRRAVLHVR